MARTAGALEAAPLTVVNMHEAKTHLSRLVKKAAAGEPFIIALAGKPTVKVMALEVAEPSKRYGFLDGRYEMPENFKEAYREDVEEMFYGK